MVARVLDMSTRVSETRGVYALVGPTGQIIEVTKLFVSCQNVLSFIVWLRCRVFLAKDVHRLEVFDHRYLRSKPIEYHGKILTVGAVLSKTVDPTSSRV